MSYFHPAYSWYCYRLTMWSLPQIFTGSLASRTIISVSSTGFPLVFFHIKKKATPCNWYFQTSQQETNSNTFGLSYGFSVVFWWTPMFYINHNTGFVNHPLVCKPCIFLCCWWTTRCVNPGDFNLQIIRGFGPQFCEPISLYNDW